MLGFGKCLEIEWVKQFFEGKLFAKTRAWKHMQA